MKIKHTSFFNKEIWSKAIPYFFSYSPSQFIKKVIAVINREYSIYLYNKDYNRFLLANADNYSDYPKFKLNPKISILLPTYNSPIQFLKLNIEAILSQSYSNWELCIADDCSTDPQVVQIVKSYATKDPRIKYTLRNKNGHISEATNSALKLATGEFVALMDHDDIIYPNTLMEYVTLINKKPKADLIYCDEDKIDTENRRFEPHFKPDWSPETLLSANYITHFAIIRKKLFDSLKGLRKGYEGAQDYDLFLRISEKTNNIYHIPKILYSWRTVANSTATRGSKAKSDYAYTNGTKSLVSAFKRRQLPAKVSSGNGLGLYQYLITPNSTACDIFTPRGSNSLGLQVFNFINTSSASYILFLDQGCQLNFKNISDTLGIFRIPEIKMLTLKMTYPDGSIFKTGFIIADKVLPAFHRMLQGGYFNFNYNLMTKNYSATDLLGTIIDVDFFKQQNLHPIKKLKKYPEIGIYLSYLCKNKQKRIVTDPLHTIIYFHRNPYKISKIATNLAHKIVPKYTHDPYYNPNLTRTEPNFTINKELLLRDKK